MSCTPDAETKWTKRQGYTLAVVCLLVGIPVGYLLRGPVSAPEPPAQRTRAEAPNPAPASPSQVPPEQLQKMADKQADALLDELKKKPNDPDVLTKLGDLYVAVQQPNKGQEYYQQALSVRPSDPNALTQLATSYYYQGDADKAIVTLQRALQIDPGYANALFNLGMIKWQAKADPKGAIELWEKLLKSNPNHPKRGQVEGLIARAKQHVNMPAGPKPHKSGL